MLAAGCSSPHTMHASAALLFIFLRRTKRRKRKGPAKLPALSPQREPPAHHRPNRILNVNWSNFINYATSAPRKKLSPLRHRQGRLNLGFSLQSPDFSRGPTTCAQIRKLLWRIAIGDKNKKG